MNNKSTASYKTKYLTDCKANVSSLLKLDKKIIRDVRFYLTLKEIQFLTKALPKTSWIYSDVKKSVAQKKEYEQYIADVHSALESTTALGLDESSSKVEKAIAANLNVSFGIKNDNYHEIERLNSDQLACAEYFVNYVARYSRIEPQKAVLHALKSKKSVGKKIGISFIDERIEKAEKLEKHFRLKSFVDKPLCKRFDSSVFSKPYVRGL